MHKHKLWGFLLLFISCCVFADTNSSTDSVNQVESARQRALQNAQQTAEQNHELWQSQQPKPLNPPLMTSTPAAGTPSPLSAPLTPTPPAATIVPGPIQSPNVNPWANKPNPWANKPNPWANQPNPWKPTAPGSQPGTQNTAPVQTTPAIPNIYLPPSTNPPTNSGK